MKDTAIKPSTIKDFQSYISKLYAQNNQSKSTEYIYSYLVRNTSYLSRSIIRAGDQEGFFLKSISWLFALSEKSEIDIEAAFRKKFPDACPYCVTKPCICAETSRKPPEHIPEWKIKDELNNKYNVQLNSQTKLTLDSAITKLNELYPNNRAIWNAYGSTYHFSRLFEEIGEVHEAYGAYTAKKVNKSALEEELADVCAWLFSAWGIQNPKNSMSDALIKYYYEGCPVCRSNPCKCEDYSSRFQALVNIDDLDKFKDLLIQISQLSPEKSDALIEVSKSLENVKETQSTTEAKRVVAKGIEILQEVETATKSAASVTGNIRSLVENGIKLAGAFSWFQ